MKTVHEMSQISGISVRTLHYYDSIGLLIPSDVSESGYRLYDDKDLEKLHSILFFKELRFSLKEIKTFFDTPGFDVSSALKDQIALLRLQRDHIDGLISLAEEMVNKGGRIMDFSAFEKTELEKYAREAKERWGFTEAYAEFESKKRKQFADESANGLMMIFADFGKAMKDNVSEQNRIELVRKLKDYITEHFYHCTPELLGGLGEMYLEDGRFRKNIDDAGGEGTAVYVADSIELFMKASIDM